ncbi:MAG: histidine phosphatase family protein, partial [Nitrospinota bacterium]
MRLYLIRHGEAASAEADAKRPLTPKGREQAERVARFLRPLGLSVSAV